MKNSNVVCLKENLTLYDRYCVYLSYGRMFIEMAIEKRSLIVEKLTKC